MSKTIKVITLFNKIANGEEVPKKIKVEDDIYVLNKTSISIDTLYRFEDEDGTNWLDKIDIELTDQVEIIEEEPEIDIQSLEEIDERYPGEPPEVIAVPFRRINELIKAIKQLDKKIKEK